MHHPSSPRGRNRIPVLNSHPRLVFVLSLLLIFMIPAMACNLPQRRAPERAPELVFPPDQAQSTSSSLPLSPDGSNPGSNPSPGSTTPEAPFPPPSISLGGKSIYAFNGLPTATPGPGMQNSWVTPDPAATPFIYQVKPGDTLPAVAARFGVSPDQITPPQPASGLLELGQELTIPNVLGVPPYPSAVLPNSVVVYSPEASGFSIEDYISQAGGFLGTYQEKVEELHGESLTGAQIVRRVAEDTSVNPKVLLAFLEFRSGWVRGQPMDPSQVDYPIGFYVPGYKGLYLELSLVAKQLNMGYYGWRDGTLTDLTFPDETHVRLSPFLNPGSVAVQTLVSKLYRQQQDWVQSIYGPQGFLALYTQMFGDPWTSAASFEPLYWKDLAQPTLELPFAPGTNWSLTGGPHVAWNTGTPRGALDFSPITVQPRCQMSSAWVTASAPGLIVRVGDGLVAEDLDGDGSEQSGWVLIYMHIAEQDRVTMGTRVDTNTPLGHPSCEGGVATGTHMHFARKYNGEWITADGPVPLVLSGWVTHALDQQYQGTLEKDGQVVKARSDGSSGSTIMR